MVQALFQTCMSKCKACIEKRRMCGQESEGDGIAGEKIRRRGRPKQRWLDNFRNDLSGEEAQDRVKRRRLIRNIDPT